MNVSCEYEYFGVVIYDMIKGLMETNGVAVVVVIVVVLVVVVVVVVVVAVVWI